MKGLLIFVGGFIAGILATFLFLYLVSDSTKPSDGLVGLTIFPEKGDCIITKSEIEIFQVIQPNMALAETGKFPDQLMVLLINYEGKSYYDNQKITVPAKKCGRQIGTYQYTTKLEVYKTVPAVVIE
jgi:hypothetical protein